MMLTVRFLGLEFVHLEINTDAAQYDDPGESTATGFGFIPSPGDQRWELGSDL